MELDKKDGIVVKIVDIFDFNGSWILAYNGLLEKRIFY